MALKDIKNKIKATERTNKVTRAMEAVSAVKMRKTQGAAIADRAYARAALSILARLAGAKELAAHPLIVEREVKKTALVVITSDKGLAGALNSGVLREAEAALRSRAPAGQARDSVRVFAYGRKGLEHFEHRGYEIARAIANKSDDVELAAVEGLAEELARGFGAGEYDQVIAVYSNFKSTFEQSPTARRLLPLSLPVLRELVADIVPEKGKFSELGEIEAPAAYTVEPEEADLIGEIAPRLVAVALYHMLLEGKAAEHSARMVAMKNASDKSKEVAHELTRRFNKIRQAAITREVSEIVGGREALAA
ncbi:MAG TPA: ATP synthase F1 subunit gamma [Candidatus Paceibacterota bacterium]|nr:ATP synthase F1 subunit gamma [Candidatus Paceibacterota bacterium]